MLRALGPAELNAKGKGLCAQFHAVLAKYPFSANATVDATVADVNGLLRKPDGALWTFYDQNLQKLLVKQGSQFAIGPSGGVNPAFLDFFNRATAFSDALYAGGQDPHFSYALKPEPSEGIQTVNLLIDGQSLSYSGGEAAAKQFTWQGGGAHGVKASVKLGGPELSFSEHEGLWAVFHFFNKADRWTPAGAGQSLEWIIRAGKDPMKLPSGTPLTVHFELDMGAAPPLFQAGFFSRLACVADVAR